MSKTLNQAFLRAFSKGQSTSRVPAPHTPHARHENAVDAPAAAQPPSHHDEAQAAWRRIEETRAVPEAPAHIPAPHLPIAELAQPTAQPILSTQETYIVSDLGGSTNWLDATPVLVIPSGVSDLSMWTALPATSPHMPDESFDAANVAHPSMPTAHLHVHEEAAHVHEEAAPHPKAHHDPQTHRENPRAPSPQNASHMHGMPQASHASTIEHVVHREKQDNEHDRARALMFETEQFSATDMAHQAVALPLDEIHPSEQVAVESVKPLVAAWEVDHFGWSAICDQLYTAEGRYFEQAGKQLREATAEGLNVLGVTSTFRGEGRTTLALLLARCAADAGVRVGVLDADFDNPQLAASVKIQPAADWRQVLSNGMSLEEAAVHSLDDRITLFPLAREARGESMRLDTPRINKLMKDVAAHFDLLIMDMGPAAADEHRLFAAGSKCPINAAVVVRDLRSTTQDQTASLVRQLMHLGVEAVGIAENFVRRAV